MAALLLVVLCCTGVSASEDERFLEGLRERRLFRVAEAYCQEKLADLKLSEVDRATLTIEYMLTLSSQAAHSPPDERAKLWQQARTLAKDFPARHPRKLVVDLQAALVALAQGELARQEAEAAGAEFTAAQALLREATQGLEAVQKQIAAAIATRRDPADKTQFQEDELFALQHNTRYQLARAKRNQALCYPAGSNDRVAAITRAREELSQLQTQLAADDPLIWRVKLDDGISARLAEDLPAAAKLLASLVVDAPANLEQHARAELARVALAAKRVEEARKIVEGGKSSAELTSAELEFAYLEVLAAQWRAADEAQDTSTAGKYRQEAVEQLAAIEKRFGAYWARRGESLVIGSAGPGEENIEILARTADARFSKGVFDAETVKIYDQAAQQALAAKNAQRFLELAYRAAVVEQRRGETEPAGQRMIAAAIALHEMLSESDRLAPRAAAMHYQGIQLRQKAARERMNTPPLDAVALFKDHLQRWPSTPTNVAAWLGLGHAQEELAKPQEAVAAFKNVPPDDAQFEAALSGVLRNWRKILADEKAKPQPTADEIASHARSVLTTGSEAPRVSAQSQRAAALGAAELLLEFAKGHAAAEELLTTALALDRNADPAWRQRAQALLVVALAGQPAKRGDAERMLADLGTDSPAELLTMLDGLTRLSQAARNDVRRDLAPLQLKAIELLRPQAGKLSAEQRTTLARMEAEALLLADRHADAIAAYEKLVKDQPDSAAVQEGFARALAGGDRASQTKALAQWRLIASRTRPQTDRWYQAKYEVALLNFRLGDKQQAAQLIKYLAATPPGLKGTPLEREFAELLRQCER